ncbi:type I restriction enzyme R protein [Perkinsela sp. CCAP 1560/4]|nr:type I restriction enzyme R protein [Perkinsela sp. CCAP 1560/4]|eukprot:KNH09664.1 type I restriction enzyme R protein [Perkinsela sp. CCAP 1560/4]
MVNERRQPVSTWKGYTLDLYRESKPDEGSDTPVALRKVAYEKEGPAIYFPKEKISVVSSFKHYLHPLLTWREFGIPAPMRFLLDRQPTNFQSFCLPYILDGKHSIVRIISESRGKKNELAILREIVTTFTIYEENTWLDSKDASPLVLHITSAKQVDDDFLQELTNSVQPELKLEYRHKIIHVHTEKALELSDHRDLRYIFVDDVPFFSVAQIEKLVEQMPFHCILVVFCVSHKGQGLISGKVAKSMESITIRQE